MQNFGGKIRCIIVDMQKAYAKLSVSENKRAVKMQASK